MMRFFVALLIAATLATSAWADTLVWQGPTKTLTIGVTQDDVAHVEFPEPITNVTLEDPSYVDILVPDGYNNRAFRIRSMLPKMATRMFLVGQSGNTYIVVLTTDIPYRSYLQITNGQELDEIKRNISRKMGPGDLVRAMANDTDVPGVNRETYVIPNWFRGSGMMFDLSEVWQSPQLTGLVVHVRNESNSANEVNLPAIVIPKTSEWGELRHASMENLRLAPAGQPGDKGLLFLVFLR
ncbi:MAG: hypothetical protein EBQ80_00470 [Proteobacteria bacterium]|nr:hypothetical protein [Pseudomonadota bacterium]